jgi:hypothetical protein
MMRRADIDRIRERRDDIRQWLEDEAPYTMADQKHLDEATPERAYWHLGYQAALTDVLAMLMSVKTGPGNRDTST